MTTTHTPGPLTAESNEFGDYIKRANGACVGETYGGEAKSLALLFAAAPDMLEALRIAHRAWGDGVLGALGTEHAHKVTDDEAEAAAAIRAAIAKAEGKDA